MILEGPLPAFARTIGIAYSGAETPTASLKGLRVYLAEGDGHPVEVQPPPSPRKYWTRKSIAEWLVERLAEDVPTLVGIDHSFSFPLRYFETHGLFAMQESHEKRRLLSFLLSNCKWEDGEVVATFREPFDMLVETATAAACVETGASANSAKNEIWLPFLDGSERFG